MITIFILSHQDGTQSSETSGFVTKLLSLILGNVPEAIVRTFGHYSEFCALGFLMLNCFYAFKGRLLPIHSILISWGYAWTDEIHQIFIDGRAFQISDLLVDLAGVLTGTALIALIIFTINKISTLINSKKSRNHK
jgi:VanZ family protein